jgi:hypothetical protein
MTSRKWIVRTAAAISAILCLNFAVAFLIDPYGIFRNPRGRQLQVAFAARKAKFLLSKRYVPTNYDGLLIGPSSSENWDPATISGVTMYNESILGSNVVEEKRIVDQALPAGHFKLALCVLYPTMTTNHALEDGLDAVSTAEALGSIHLYIHEVTRILSALHLPAGKRSSADGSTPLKLVPQNFVEIQYDPSYFHLDTVALDTYNQIVRELTQHGIRVIYIIPPLYEPCRHLNQAAFDAYKETMLQTLPQAQILDFDGREFDAFRNDASNFVDCFHVNAAGAETINEYLAQHIS